MIDLSDLGLTPPESASTLVPDAPVVDSGHQSPESNRIGLVPGSALARALYSVWSGDPVVLCDSPPGAGKTSLLVDLVDQLLGRTAFQVVIACPTRRGAADVAERLAEQLSRSQPDESKRPLVSWDVRSGAAAVAVPRGAVSTSTDGGSIRLSQARATGLPVVSIRTVASCVTAPPVCDLLIIDEAYQTTFADVMSAADRAAQIFMVGDPGQIGPVITVNTSAWDSMRDAPHRRAPEVFAVRPETTVMRLEATYRLGQRTVDAIAPLYGFDFDSRRPEKFVTDRNGNRVPEVSSRLVPPPSSYSDVPTMALVAETAGSFVGMQVTETDRDGVTETRQLRQGDVAVVVAHTAQVNGVRGALDKMALDNVIVGTADSLQGGQWHAVVALDPIVGQDSLSDHQMSEGRLCVMASRHMSALVWVHDGTAEAMLFDEIENRPEAAKHIAVRRSLCADTIDPTSLISLLPD